MTAKLAGEIGQFVRTARMRLDISQRQLGRAAGVSGAYVAMIEAGTANPTVAVIERIATALGLEFELAARGPAVIGVRQRDLVHARCSAHVSRRLTGAGMAVVREVEVAAGRVRGWIDILAFDRASGTLLVIEIKTRLDDVGAVERQLALYERTAPGIAAARGWTVRRVHAWLLLLASEEVEASVRINRAVLGVAFPVRAADMRRILDEVASGRDREASRSSWPRSRAAARGLAVVEPQSRRRAWLVSTHIDGRRRRAPYRNYADAAFRLGSG
ncbi:MAG: helix-turn-helix transcriptional regulator [Chloroflexi bacterium]|nr:helix-turn-helix transcriptional regulator [Chloroflexota bacterium]